MSATQPNALLSRNNFLSPYTSVDDERFEWLMSTFLPYFTNWKNSTESRRGGPYSNTDKARLFTSSSFFISIKAISILRLGCWLKNNRSIVL